MRFAYADPPYVERAARGWTVRDLAPQLGISAATLSRIERGQVIDANTLLRIWQWCLALQKECS